MTLGNMAKIEFLALPENVGFCRVAVAAFASQLDFTLDELEEIKVGVSEAITNAIIHGYQNGPSGIVRVYLDMSDKRLEIRVEDDGVGIPDADKEHIFDRSFGQNTGFGLFLAREILGITGLSIRENGVHGKGARFEIIIPHGAHRLSVKP